MATFDQIKSGLNQISNEITRARLNIDKARTYLADAETTLAAMGAKWSGLGSEIDQVAANNPSDDNYKISKGEKDKLVVDFQRLSTYASNLIAAFDGVTE